MTTTSNVTVGPFLVYFTNRNKAMALRGHSHAAEVLVTFANTGRPDHPGWPSFERTNRRLADLLREALAHPIVGTNEDVADHLWNTVALLLAHPPSWLASWLRPSPDCPVACAFQLEAVELRVLGVPDEIGHDHGFTSYRVTRAQELTITDAQWARWQPQLVQDVLNAIPADQRTRS